MSALSALSSCVKAGISPSFLNPLQFGPSVFPSSCIFRLLRFLNQSISCTVSHTLSILFITSVREINGQMSEWWVNERKNYQNFASAVLVIDGQFGFRLTWSTWHTCSVPQKRYIWTMNISDCNFVVSFVAAQFKISALNTTHNVQHSIQICGQILSCDAAVYAVARTAKYSSLTWRSTPKKSPEGDMLVCNN